MDVNEKLKILRNTTLKALEKKHGEDSYYLGDKKIPKVPLVCSSGSISLDNALCIGGFPEGRVIEIGGQESSGKSTLTLINIAEIQRNGKLCAYIDAEQSFDPVWASKMNVDVEKLLVTQPDTMEEAFEALYSIMDSGVVSYVVIDSTNALTPRRVFEGEDVGDATMALAARILSQELPKIASKCAQTKCTVVFLSQVRSGMDKYHPEVIGRGNALKFTASIRIKTSKADVEKDDGDEGQSKVTVRMNVFKNKVGIPFKKAEFTLLTGENGKYGIDTNKEIMEFGVKFDIIKRAGAWYTYGENRFQGFDNVVKFFNENPSVYAEVRETIMSKLAEERDKEQHISADDSFNSTLKEVVEENEKPKRAIKSKMEGNMEELSIVDNKTSDAEVVEEKTE